MKTFVFKLCNMVLSLVSFIFIALVAIPDKKDPWVGKALLPFGITIPLFTITDLVMTFSCGQICHFLPLLKLDPFSMSHAVGIRS